ncbi:hypothetical protein FHX14_000005 [Rhizobium sp. BK619]|uniref:hypothetical protein n=1 Tax=Rhizobium sp. BK619 TaxID=2586989 RepID=UPI001857F2A3|nr:hypothetical protein [Rhizobium sp. BK619]MBB3643846.1 hypothetical protein [Rhizobium sp. BK619]
MNIARKSFGFKSNGSSSGFNGYGLILVDDKSLEALRRACGVVSQQATSGSGGLRSMPTHGTPMVNGGLLRRGTAASASPTVLAAPDDVPLMLAEIKRMTGFGWNEIGELLGCTRQTVYNWTQGAAVRAENAKRISALHETVKFFDRGPQEENAGLIATSYAGRTVRDMLTSGEFAVVKRLTGRGAGRPPARWSPVEPVLSGRQDHWTDRIGADMPEEVDAVTGFLPNKVVKKVKLKVK